MGHSVVRRLAAVLAFTAAVSPGVVAHSGLRFSSPIEGVSLGDTPASIQLTMGEQPEPALSAIRVLDTAGAAWDVGRPALVPGDPLTLFVAVRSLPTGVYTVNWRVVSAVDGHATTGSYVFGVRASPQGVAAQAAATTVAPFDVAIRTMLAAGLVLLLGAACAHLARFGGPRDLGLAIAGWLLSAAGLVLLVTAQRRNSGASLSALLETSVGSALLWRAGALAAAGAALAAALVSRQPSTSRLRSAMMAGAALAALVAIAVHVAAGHAAGARSYPLAAIAAQWAHFAASGIWIGGLAALLLGIRGAPSEEKAMAVGRFSRVAAAGIVVVLLTGLIRAFNELTSWGDLTATAYGRAVLAKGALFAGIAVLGAINRWRTVPGARTTLGPLRKLVSGELGLAAGTLVAAAFLGTLPPPAAATVVPGIAAAGADFGTTVRAELSAVSDHPGPNRFVARIADYDTGQPVREARVALRFMSLDDPAPAITSLPLTPAADGAYAGSGAHLSFDGRWRVTVDVERAGTSVQIPLDVAVRGPLQPVSIERMEGQSVKYTVEVRGLGSLRFSPEPERAGRSKLYVTCYDLLGDERRVAHMVATLASGEGPARALPLERLGVGRFVAEIELTAGSHGLTAVARTADGTRMRAAVRIDVPAR